MEPRAYKEMAHDEATHWWFVGRRRICAGAIERIFAGRRLRILEVGCGTGGNIAMLTRWGEVVAFEPDEFAREHAQREAVRLSTAVCVADGRCPDGMPDVGHFDLICMFDVLEHIAEDARTLSALGERLRSGGRILLTVPAYPLLWGPHDQFLHHQRRYTRRSLCATVRSAGLRIERLSSFNTLLLPLAVAARMSEAVLKPRLSMGRSVPRGWINDGLLRVFSLEASILQRCSLPFGLSMMAVLRRDAPPTNYGSTTASSSSGGL